MAQLKGKWIENVTITNDKLAGSIADSKLATPYIKADGTRAFTGNQAMGSNKITGLADGTDANDAVNKSQLDNAISGISWKEPVSTADTAPPVSPTDGQRVLVNGVGTGDFSGHDNAIATYDLDTTSWSFESPSANWAVLVEDTEVGYTYDLDTTTWIQFTGTGQINAGVGLTKSGNTLNVNLGAGIKELPSDEVGIDVASNGGLELTSELTDAQLQIKADSTTGATVAPLTLGSNGAGVSVDNTTIEHSGGTIGIKDAGVDENKLNSSVAGNGISGGAGSALAVAPDSTGGANLATVVNVSANGVAVKIDDDTIGENGSNQLYVKADSIGANEIDETDNYTFTGAIDVTGGTITAPTQSQGDDSTNVATTAYVDTAVAGGGTTKEVETLTYTDTSNKVIGPLSSTPASVGDEIEVTPYGGPDQEYTVDYTVREVTGGAADGYYICVATDSAAPGGGSFSGGSNPSTGIDSTLVNGDKVKASYSS